MELNYCFKCMEKIESYPCPKCGFDGKITLQTTYQLAPGRILDGKYLVGDVIGHGGFGITYLGYNLVLDNKIAIKEYYPKAFADRDGTKSAEVSWSVDEDTEQRKEKGILSVIEEAKKMARVGKIDTVVRVQDAFRANNTAYIIMEYVEGETLKQHLSRTGPMKWQEVKEKLYPVIDALEKVHNNGIVHRDISPDNIMLLPDGNVKILDLGAAKDISKIDVQHSEQVIKVGFSPFEQYMASGESAPCTDVYALAATMIYSLTGKVPPGAPDRIQGKDLDWEDPLLKELPPNVLSALKKAMESKKSDRFQSMSEFKGALEGNIIPKPKKKTGIIIGLISALIVAGISVFAFLGNKSNDNIAVYDENTEELVAETEIDEPAPIPQEEAGEADTNPINLPEWITICDITWENPDPHNDRSFTNLDEALDFFVNSTEPGKNLIEFGQNAQMTITSDMLQKINDAYQSGKDLLRLCFFFPSGVIGISDDGISLILESEEHGNLTMSCSKTATELYEDITFDVQSGSTPLSWEEGQYIGYYDLYSNKEPVEVTQLVDGICNNVGYSVTWNESDRYSTAEYALSTQFPLTFRVLIAPRDTFKAEDIIVQAKTQFDFGKYSSGLMYLDYSAGIGNPDAQTMLGQIYQNGEYGVETDIDKAITYYLHAAENEYAEAEKILGDLYSEGKLVRKDEDMAEYWYGRAAEHGFNEEQNSLA